MILLRAVDEHPGFEGILLGSHGLFTWGDTQHECYLNSIKTIDQMGEFVEDHARASGRPLFGGAVEATTVDSDAVAYAVLPHLGDVVSSNRRVIAHFNRSDAALALSNSRSASYFCRIVTSCPDHFLRTRICPMFVPWNPADEQADRLQQRIGEQIGPYRDEYVAYYQSCARADSPPLRD
jgi:rhamnose utilization protein RhaD (predicted bifunctional aldolase and dehydrogenase)